MMLGIHSCRYLSLLSLLIFLHDITKNIRMQQYSYMNIDDKKSLQILYHSFETTGNMHNVHIYKKKKKKFQ